MQSLVIPVTEAEGGGVQDAAFVFNRHLDSSTVEVRLRNPEGETIDADLPGWSIETDATNKVYRFDHTLAAGDYTVELQSNEDVQGLVSLSGRIVHGVDIDLALSQVRGNLPKPQCVGTAQHTDLRGPPITVIANLTDAHGGIEGLSVLATLFHLDGSVNRLSLYDDGSHGDGLNGDGIYANQDTRTPFYSQSGMPDVPAGPPTGEWGSYTVLVTADGKSHYDESFSRSQMLGFQVYEYAEKTDCQPDFDEDEPPDRWEDL